jgi:hypothetical protein
MTRLQKTVLRTLAVFVFGFAAAAVLIVPATTLVLAQAPKPSDETSSDAPSPAEISRFLDDRKPEPPAPAKVAEPAVDGATVAYPFDTLDAAGDARRLQEQYAGRANISLEIRPKDLGIPYLLARAPADVQAEIRAVVGFLTKQRPDSTAASAWDNGGPGVSATADSAPMMPTAAPRRATQYGYFNVAQQQQAEQERIRAWRLKLTDAKSEDEKKAARTELRQLLAGIFARDMQMREKQAAEIESRLGKLRQQYQVREKVKDEIIELQLKVIEQDAAGLGFPSGQSSVPTVPSGVGPSTPFGNRANLPASATPRDPLVVGSQNPGASARDTHVDQFDPIPAERTLADVKRIHAAVVATLTKQGRFIESADGKLYAYVNVNWPAGPSVIRVIDSATGKLLGTAMVNSIVRALQFTDDGVASRERDNKLELRVPLKRGAASDGDVFEPLATNPNPLDPVAAALDPEFLEKYSTAPQTRFAELAARGHVVGSPDGKHYAYVETKGDNIPQGTAEIRVCDVRTGQCVAAARIKSPVATLRFFNQGVATEDPDGTLKLQLSFLTEHDTQDVWETTLGSSGMAPEARQSRTFFPGTDSYSSFTSEYNALRNQYRQARASLAAAEAKFNATVASAQQARPETTGEDAKKQFPTEWRAVERARSDHEAAHRALETKLELLELDRKTAMLTRDATETKLMELTDRYKQNAATLPEVNQQRTSFEAAELNVERATTLLNFFKSISSELVPEDPTSAQGEAVSSSNDPVALSASVRHEAVAMLQGTWNCVAASSAADADPDRKHLSKDELAALALQLTIKDDNVTISYYGDDLQEHQTAGKLLIDTGTSPPQCHIDINVAGIQAQSRLSGVTRLDGGVLHMTRPGGTFLIHRKFDSEPSMFEFKLNSSDTVRR